MNSTLKTILIFLIGTIFGIGLMYFFSNYKLEKVKEVDALPSSSIDYTTSKKSAVSQDDDIIIKDNIKAEKSSIDELTEEHLVIDYVKKHHRLPDYYIKKNEAKQRGWVPSKGNLCEVLPGRAIGGDKFSNREKKLPASHQYYEADVNYNCGNRGADRIVFTKDGKVWLTKNHYKTFEKQ